MIRVRKLRSFPFLTNEEIMQYGSVSAHNGEEDSEVNFKGSIKDSYRFELHDHNNSVHSSCLGACSGPS